MSIWDQTKLWGNAASSFDETNVQTDPSAEGVVFKCKCPGCGCDAEILTPWPEVAAAFQGQTIWNPKQPSVGLAQDKGRYFLACTQQCKCGTLLKLFEDAYKVQSMAPRAAAQQAR